MRASADSVVSNAGATAGEFISHYRRIRGVNQIELALECESSARNISFIENDRTKPSESLLKRICEVLEIPMRDRLLLYRAGCYELPGTADELEGPAVDGLRKILSKGLRHFEPYPAVLMDRSWRVLDLTAGMFDLMVWLFGAERFAEFAAEDSLELLFRRDALRPFLPNWEVDAQHILHRLYREAAVDNPDGRLSELYERLLAIEGVPSAWRAVPNGNSNPFERVSFRKGEIQFDFTSVHCTMGTPADLAYQAFRTRHFMPADDRTRALFHEHIVKR